MSAPAYQVMPPLSADDFAALKADILLRGVMIPVEYDEAGNILDGHHRVKACEDLRIRDWPRVIREGFSESEKWTHARHLNIARRHLNQEQRRGLIADQLKQTPEFSDRRIAEGLGVDHKTVATVRDALEEGGEIPHLSTVESKDGQPQPRKPRLKKTKYVDNTPAGRAGAKERAREIREAEIEVAVLANKVKASMPVDIPAGKFSTLVIDPPWPTQIIARDLRPNQVAFDYPTMSEDELLGMAESIKAKAADDCHLFLWATQRFLPLALHLLTWWGFDYVFTMVWHKPGGFQPLGLAQYNCEFAIYGRQGAPQFLDTKAFATCFSADRREHSRKPDSFYDLVRRVTDGPRLDWFSREAREGFAQIGNETDKFKEAG